MVPRFHEKKKLSVFVSREEIRKGAQLGNSIAHFKVGLPFDTSFLKRKIVKSEYVEIDMPKMGYSSTERWMPIKDDVKNIVYILCGGTYRSLFKIFDCKNH